MSKLIIWSKSALGFLSVVKDSDDVVVYSYSEMKEKLSNSQKYHAILLQVELNWTGHYLQDFYGFDIALELRTKYKQKCPIVLFSCLSAAIFEGLALSQVKYNILFGRGTGFVELRKIERQFVQKVIKEIEPLSDASLTDVSEMLCNLKGLVVDKLTHDLKFESSEVDLNQTLKAVRQYLSSEQLERVSYVDFTKNLLNSKFKNNIEEFIKLKNAFVTLCASELVNSGGGDVKKVARKQYKILVLEDDAEFLERVKAQFSKHFEVVPTSKATEAIEILDKDEKNDITAIVSDWRLYRDSTKYWQKQGYEVLEYAAKHRHIALFSLTSEEDFNVHSIRNMLGLDIYLTKKQSLRNQEQWDALIERVKYQCRQTVDLINSIPSHKNWIELGLAPEYCKIRSYKNWNIFEERISKTANIVFEYYRKSWDQSLKDYIPLIEWHRLFGITFHKTNPSIAIVLIARRVFLGLWYNAAKLRLYVKDKETGRYKPEKAKAKIYLVLYGKIYQDYLDRFQEEEASVELNKTANYQLVYKLCFNISTINDEILPEERAWLISQNIHIGQNTFAKNIEEEEEFFEEEEEDNMAKTEVISHKSSIEEIDVYKKIKKTLSKRDDYFLLSQDLYDGIEDFE